MEDVKRGPVPEGFKVITEGRASMLFPSDEDQAVFYNPVQVQNRDLSVLMIALYAERRAKRRFLKEKKKELTNQAMERCSAPPKHSNQLPAETKAAIQTQLDALGRDTNWTEQVTKEEHGLFVLDALAASGLRSIRYIEEIPGVQQVLINDLDPTAVEQAKHNIEYNQLSDKLITDEDSTKSGIRVQVGDATHVMYMHRRIPGLKKLSSSQAEQKDQLDVIDLDPYGSAAPFLDGAVQAVVDGGLLCITCTDMAALGGSHPETCYGRYGSMPIPRGRYLQELALRILLSSIATAAARYGRTMKPILSVGMNFYVRVFVEIYDDKASVNKLSLNIGQVYQSTQCPTFFTVPHGQYGSKSRNIYQPNRSPPEPCCPDTGGPFKMAGPAWLGPLHDLEVVNEALERLEETPSSRLIEALHTKTKIHGLLTVVSEELPDVPLYYTLPDLCHTLHCDMPPLQQVKAALVNAGYRVSVYHKEAQAIKTDAPSRIVWDILRAWVKLHPVKPTKPKKINPRHAPKESDDATKHNEQSTNNHEEQKQRSTVAERILAVPPSIQVDFTIPNDFESNRRKATRFPQNPEANWGPKPAAGKKRKKPTPDDCVMKKE
eukprot:scaffold33622_cov51-Attheya_sp.AAC.5